MVSARSFMVPSAGIHIFVSSPSSECGVKLLDFKK